MELSGTAAISFTHACEGGVIVPRVLAVHEGMGIAFTSIANTSDSLVAQQQLLEHLEGLTWHLPE